MDLYAELGVARGATEEEMTRAYRTEARRRHPDRPGGDKEAFQRLQVAYEILSDPVKRAEYDATGQIPGAAEGPGGGGGGMPDLSAIFGSLFGGGGGMGGMGGFPMPPPNFFAGGGGPPGARLARGPNKLHDIGVSLRDMYHGKTCKLTMKRDILCPGCEGRGGAKVEPCRSCRGAGMRMRAQQMGPITAMMQEPCGDCGASGQRILEPCGECSGKRVVERTAQLDVAIEPGAEEGDRIVLPGQCSESPMYERPGDVVLVIRPVSSDTEGRWLRKGADLAIEIELTVAESLLGWARELEGHPSEKPLRLAWRGGVVRDGEVLRVPGWGMPGRNGSHGELKLICRVAAVDQTAWTEEQMRALRSVWPDWVEPSIEGVETPERS
jgi:DnaJ family protein A protein 2